MVDDKRYDMVSAAPQISNALAAVESSRAVAEVQASLVIAKANPRDETRAEYDILQACKRETLAKSAMYLYRRGGTNITGPSIRLAEVMARCWGNINYGFRELDRGKDYSEVEAFAHDLQTNTRVTRQFRVAHSRDKTSGNVALTQERDKYEMVASMAQRRVRACLLEIIPGDIVEMAVESCDATLNGSVGDIGQASTAILEAFDKVGVTKVEIEGYLQRKMASLVPADIVNLRKIYTSIKTGIAPKEEFFREDDVAKLNERFSGNNKRKAPAKKKKAPAKEKPAEPEKTPEDPPIQTESEGPQKGSGGLPETTHGGPPETLDQSNLAESDPNPPFDPWEKEEAEEALEDQARREAREAINGEDDAKNRMVSCPEAGGMMIDSIDCPDADCFPGCKVFNKEE